MSETTTTELWAIVEIMGHKRYAGRVTEHVLAGHGFIRVDIPAIPGGPGNEPIAAWSKTFGAGAIYGITWVDRETATLAAVGLRERPVDTWTLSEWKRQIEAVVPGVRAITQDDNAEDDDPTVAIDDDDEAW